MKPLFSLYFFGVFSLNVVFSQQDSLRLSGTFENVPDTAYLHFFTTTGNVGSLKDTLLILNGKFSHTYLLEESPQKIILAKPDFSSYRNIWVTNSSTIEVEGDYAQLSDIHVTGSPLEDIDQKLKAVEGQLPERLKIIEEYIHTPPAIQDLYWLAYKGQASIDTIQALYDVIPVAQQAYDFAKRLGSMLEVRKEHVPTIQDTLIDFMAIDQEGNSQRLSQLNDRYLLLEFGSASCGPCVMAIPEMRDLHESANSELRIVSFGMETREKAWKEGLSRMERNKGEMPWVHLWDGEGDNGLVRAQYKINGTPSYFLFDSKGKLLDSWFGYVEGRIVEKWEEAKGE
ncbi:MAG: TlpA disulfide reductase family protein [Bacteroidota bacterium]